MVVRVGVWATAASAVIFSILLLSNVIAFSASQGREVLYTRADAADFLNDEAAALMGASGTDVLLAVQAGIAAATLGCSTALRTTADLVGALVEEQNAQGVTVTTDSALAAVGSVTDNLSSLNPFDGSVSGDLDVRLAMVVSGNLSAEGTSMAKHETHYAHLPARVAAMAADCESAYGLVRDAVSISEPANCTSEDVAPIIEGAAGLAASMVGADGFKFGLGYSISVDPTCAVKFAVHVEQTGVQGPGGPFSVQLEQEGAATFAPTVSSQQG